MVECLAYVEVLTPNLMVSGGGASHQLSCLSDLRSQKEQPSTLAADSCISRPLTPTSLHKSCPQHEPKAGIREPKLHPKKAEPIPTFCLGSS